MGESPRHEITEKTTQRSNTVLLLVGTALDTTWRTLVPGLTGLIVGLVLDKMWHTTPIVMIIGLVIGVASSAVLVYAQFKAVKK